MCVDTERLVPDLTADGGAGPLFKMRRDPRITPVGRILHRYSLDELPPADERPIAVVRGRGAF